MRSHVEFEQQQKIAEPHPGNNYRISSPVHPISSLPAIPLRALAWRFTHAVD